MLNMVSPAARREQQAARKAQLQWRQEILLWELSQAKLSGKPIAYRRLDSLMLAAGTNRSQTVQLLKQLGARPCSRRGRRYWTEPEVRWWQSRRRPQRGPFWLQQRVQGA